VKRRKASVAGELASSSEARFLLVPRGVLATETTRSFLNLTLRDLPGSDLGKPRAVGRTTTEGKPMARQKSENPTVPEGRRKAPQTEHARGGRGVPVDKESGQLALPLAAAECPKGATRRKTEDLSSKTTTRVPRASGKRKNRPSPTLNSTLECLDEALQHVVRNKGAPGTDGQTVEDLQKDWGPTRRTLARALRAGTYTPGDIRRVEIPKPGGGVRRLGIPNVVDRVVQAAVTLCLQPTFEPVFHESSHGFRPKRSCHTALTEAKAYVEEGSTWVVDLDLSKFFDRVNHQRLMARVALRVQDRPLLELLGRLLKTTVVLPDGVQVVTEEGVPQGGPLSPLLSNIVLDELDQELSSRGHRFVRYADDVAIFVRTERAGIRVMTSVTRFIEGRMRLKVNAEKSQLRRPEEGNFLGFRLTEGPDGEREVQLSERTMTRAMNRIRELTPWNWGGYLKSCLSRLDQYFQGWIGFFGICSPSARADFQALDGRARRRLRALKLKQWKRKRTIVRRLRRMKPSPKIGPNVFRGRRSWWALSNNGVVTHRLSRQWFRDRGLTSLVERLEAITLFRVAPAQQSFLWG